MNGWPTSAEGENGLLISLRAARAAQSLSGREAHRKQADLVMRLCKPVSSSAFTHVHVRLLNGVRKPLKIFKEGG